MYHPPGRNDWATIEVIAEATRPMLELIQKLMVGTIRRRLAMQEETEVSRPSYVCILVKLSGT